MHVEACYGFLSADITVTVITGFSVLTGEHLSLMGNLHICEGLLPVQERKPHADMPLMVELQGAQQ